ncbi:MAG: TRAP transporter fused permease subunit, partial [Bacillota bacterium]
ATGLAAFEFWVLTAGKIDPYIHSATFLCFMLPIVFLIYGATVRSKDLPSFIDIVFVITAIAAGIYILSHSTYFLNRWPMASPLSFWDLFFGAALIVMCFDACRRTLGPAMTVVVSIFVLYALFGHLIPGPFFHTYLGWRDFIDQLSFTINGIMGSTTQVAATYVFVFVTFGIFLDVSGGGNFFFRLAHAAAGRQVGGPAKVTSLACGLYGMISGSPTSDTVTVGSFAIPTMKRVGYDSIYAGAVTAVSATGGAIVPPVMGTSAFLMAQMTGIPYIEICIAAIIPAIFYYFGIMLQIHFHTLRYEIKSTELQDLPPLREVLLTQSQYFLPVIILIYLMVRGYTPTYAGIIAILAAIAVSWTRRETRLGPRKIWDAVVQGCFNVAPLLAVCAAAGIVVGCIMVTGLASKFIVLINTLSGGILPLALVIGAVVLIVLGMGMPLPAVYVLGAVLIAPILIELGFPLKLAHLFIVYYSAMSAITPPVAVAAYAAGGIAGADPMAIGWRACRLGIVAYLVPFIFMFQPALILEGNPIEVIWAVVTAAVGVFALSAGIEGWLRKLMLIWERIAAILGGILMMYPDILFTGIGALLVLLGLFRQFFRAKKHEIAKPL